MYALQERDVFKVLLQECCINQMRIVEVRCMHIRASAANVNCKLHHINIGRLQEIHPHAPVRTEQLPECYGLIHVGLRRLRRRQWTALALKASQRRDALSH